MVTKRTLLKGAAGAGVTVFTGIVPGLAAAARPLRVRRSVNNMTLDDPDLETYRDFVGYMRARPESERVSWVGFANQHGTATNFKYCPHGDWYFLPWHRAFVMMYENAAAKLMKNPKFAMPYWDWTALRTYPQAFSDKLYKGKPNPLYVPSLGDSPSTVRNPLNLSDSIVGQKVIDSIYKETVFELFGTSRSVDKSVTPPKVQDNDDPKWVTMRGGNQGILERTPHNLVHNAIGGYMPQTNSPRDPIFMMHHGNIDRIWASWNALGRKNSNDPLWLNMKFTDNYIDPNGKLYTMVVKKLLDTKPFGYTYDTIPKPDHKLLDTERLENLAALINPKLASKAPRVKAANVEAARVQSPLSLQVAVGEAMMAPAVKPAAKPREIVAVLNDIKVGANVDAVRVFVNADKVSADTPESDPHFVTIIGFLVHNGAHDDHGNGGGKGESTVVPLTETLQNLFKTQQLPTDKITVQLVPVPRPGAAPASVGDVTPASVEIAVI